MEVETCATEGCQKWPEFPDETGTYFCRDCYDAPNDGEFTHVPEEPTNYRSELKERYNR